MRCHTRSSIENIWCLITQGLKFSLWHQHLTVACLVNKQTSSNLVSWQFVSVFQVILHCKSPQVGIIKLDSEWCVEAYFWKSQQERDDLTVIRTPKLLLWKHGGWWVKLSLWPFCGWIPRPTKAIWMNFDF